MLILLGKNDLGSDCQCLKVRCTNMGELDKALLQKGASAQKTCVRKKDPCLPLTQVVCLSPSHWSGQGARSSQLAKLKQTYWEKCGGAGGGVVQRKVAQMKPGQNGVTKTSFDRKDIC